MSIILLHFHWLKRVVLTLDCMRTYAWRIYAHCAVREAKDNGRRLRTKIRSSWARHWVSFAFINWRFIFHSLILDKRSYLSKKFVKSTDFFYRFFKRELSKPLSCFERNETLRQLLEVETELANTVQKQKAEMEVWNQNLNKAILKLMTRQQNRTPDQ